jgi:excisionase family DNA binding protein
MNEIMTPAQVAEMLQLGPSSVYKLAAQRELPSIQFRGARRLRFLRFRRADVESWIEAHTEPAGRPRR